MSKLLLSALVCVVVTLPALAQSESSPAEHAAIVATKGKMLTAANGSRLGTVYRVTSDGSPQVIIDGRMATIPAATLSLANGELTTSMSKSEVISQR